jgi:hypothetical protein
MQFRSPDELPETGGSKNFIKLKDKESISGIIMGEIHEFFILWENGKSREVSEDTPGAKFRFRVNFVIKEGSVYVPKILEQGLIVYKDLAAINEEYPLEQTVIKLTRNGTGTDTTYSLLPLLKQQPTEKILAHLSTIELLSLTSTKGADAGPPKEHSEIPF